MQQQQREYSFEFTGDGAEYFKIWIVNLALSLLTLGIYSAWAKVRRLQYFYRNTRLGNANFDYHGTPIAILKGRIIAVTLFLLYVGATEYLPPAPGLLLVLLLASVMPWLIVRSLRFKLYNSSYRGLRFSFAGQTRQAYVVFLLFPVLTLFTFYLLAPFTHQRIKRYQHQNSKFGTTPFDFTASAGSFYGIYLRTAGIMIVLGIVAGISVSMAPVLAALAPFAFVFAGLLASSYLAVRLFNLIWSSTSLGEHSFSSRMEVDRYLWLTFTNLLGILVTLGLYMPFASVRMMRYKIENLGMLAQGELTDFVAGQTQPVGAAGQEISEIFDVDISL